MMKSLKYRLKKHEVTITNTDWNKYDDRLMKAVERGEVDKVAAVLSKKGIIPTKLDVEGRSAFHLAATRGHLDCLNHILGHNVDVTATDASGKNALHLSSRNGHSLCVQKLLQHNCPVGNVDLQGRTALHDAVMAGCSSSVKLLCESGASVNTSDFDGRTPLVLATQMSHPRICQLLLERGADITIRDKQNKTALILGCEYGCKDAVEVLMKSGADVKAVDGLGHDAFHYARLSKNPELVALVKSSLEKATRDKEAARIEQWKKQDMERQNDALQESLRQYHQEQTALMEKVSMLQQQLTQEKTTVEGTQKENEQLKVLLSAKEKEEGIRGSETVKVQLRSTLGDYSGQSVIKGKENALVKQAHSLDSDRMLHNSAPSRQMTRTPEKSQPTVGHDLSSELDALRHEHEAVKRQQQAVEEEAARLQSALNRKNRECQELVQSRDSTQKQADQQVQELEDALRDVQKRMLDSECKVKQLQTHVVAVKEHLGGQAVEELRAQLQDIKAKYEGASAEVCRVRNRLKQSEKALEEYKSSESQLAAEAERLNQDLGAVTDERDDLADALVEMEMQLKEARTKHGNTVPAEKFDNMKNLLTNAVDEKERQLAELREDYDRVLEEVAELNRKLDSPSSQSRSVAAMSAEEQQRIQADLEEQNASLKKKLVDLTGRSQALIHEVKESEEERDILREQLDEFNSRVEIDFIPIQDHENARRDMVAALEDLEDKLVEASERYGKAEAQVKQLQTERTTLLESISTIQSSSDRQQSEREDLRSQNADLMKEMVLLHRRCEDGDRECVQLSTQIQTLKQSLEREHVPRQQHEQVKMELTSTLENVQAERLKFETKGKVSGEELEKVKEGNDKLKEELDRVQLEMKKDFMRIEDHKATTEKMSAAVVEAEKAAREESAKYLSAQEEMGKLNRELLAQKKELDTIQEAIQSRFIPVTTAEEKEQSYIAQVKELTVKQQEMEEKYSKEISAGQSSRREKEKLKVEIESVQQRLDSALVSSEKHRDVEEGFKIQFEELTQKLANLEQQHKELTAQKADLEDQNALCNSQIQNLQGRLKSELSRISTYDSELKALHDAVQQAQSDCKKARESQQEEALRVCALQKELQESHTDQNSLLQRAKSNEALEAEVTKLRMALREEEENSAQRAEDVSALQSELLQATQALQELRSREDQMNQLKTEKQQLQEEVAKLSNKLQSLTEEFKEARQQSTQAREDESRAVVKMEAVQAKGHTIEREIRELKERYDESLSTIGDLQRRIQTSAQQTEAKDKKITELLTDVERLKQALNGLSQLAYTSNAPNKRQTQHVDTLQAQIKSLQQQLADAERQHRDVVSIYRTHLLSAAQGHMDEDVQAALLQIIRMRQEFVC